MLANLPLIYFVCFVCFVCFVVDQECALVRTTSDSARQRPGRWDFDEARET
jgi:hypothetical protein